MGQQLARSTLRTPPLPSPKGRLGEPEQMLQWARKAYLEWSRDLITVYWLALACYENSLWQEAISHSDTILQWDFRNLAYGPHGDGAEYARQLTADCNAVKGLSLLALNRPEGRQYLQKYLQRAREQTSWFSRAYVRRRLQQG